MMRNGGRGTNGNDIENGLQALVDIFGALHVAFPGISIGAILDVDANSNVAIGEGFDPVQGNTQIFLDGSLGILRIHLQQFAK